MCLSLAQMLGEGQECCSQAFQLLAVGMATGDQSMKSAPSVPPEPNDRVHGTIRLANRVEGGIGTASAPANNGDMLIFVKTLDGRDISLEVQPEDTVATVKPKVQAKVGQRFILLLKVLESISVTPTHV